MALFSECQPVKFHLPSKASWGLTIGDTHDGVLYVDNVETNGAAWNSGLRNGDYIFQLQGKTVVTTTAPVDFLRKVVETKKTTTEQQIALSIMRKNQWYKTI